MDTYTHAYKSIDYPQNKSRKKEVQKKKEEKEKSKNKKTDFFS